MIIDGRGVRYRAFMGDHHPAELYLGSRKITGWHNQTQTGNALTFAKTYNDRFSEVRVKGTTTETGTGDKSPDNPYTLQGVTKTTVNGVDYALPQTLYSLPDGTVDNYDVISGSGTQNVGKVLLNGSTDGSWALWGGDGFERTNSLGFLIPNGTVKLLSNDNAVCNRFNFSRDADTLANSIDNDGISTGDMSYVFVIRILKSRLEGWSDSWTYAQKIAAFRAWLAANPVTILYELAEPVAISGTAQTIPAHYPQTTLTSDVEITATAKIMDAV